MPRPVRGSGTLGVAITQTRGQVADRLRPPRPAVRAGGRRPSTTPPCAPSSRGSCDINILLLSTQIKRFPHTPSHHHPLELKVTFCLRRVLTWPCPAPVP